MMSRSLIIAIIRLCTKKMDFFWQHYAEIDYYLSVFSLNISRKVQKATHILPRILYLQQFNLTRIQLSIRKTLKYPSAVCISVVDQVSLKKTLMHYIDGKKYRICRNIMVGESHKSNVGKCISNLDCKMPLVLIFSC